MESPKDKAKSLTLQYYNEMNPNQPDCNISYRQAMRCVEIAIDQILKIHLNPQFHYLVKVKNELLKLKKDENNR